MEEDNNKSSCKDDQSSLTCPSIEKVVYSMLQDDLESLQSPDKSILRNDIIDIFSEGYKNIADEIIAEDLRLESPDNASLVTSNSLDTSNGISIRSIVPNCGSCQIPCTFESITSPKTGKCSIQFCTSKRSRAYEFQCKNCDFEVCLPCSQWSGTLGAVEQIVRTADCVTALTGNNGKFEVLIILHIYEF